VNVIGLVVSLLVSVFLPLGCLEALERAPSAGRLKFHPRFRGRHPRTVSQAHEFTTNARGDRSEVLEGEVRNDNALNGTQVDQFTCQNSGDITAADTQLWRLRNANANGPTR
jgi:hypothetical protein